MIEAIGWLTIAWIIMSVGKAIGRRLWPEDWEPGVLKDRGKKEWPSEESQEDMTRRLWPEHHPEHKEKDELQ